MNLWTMIAQAISLVFGVIFLVKIIHIFFQELKHEFTGSLKFPVLEVIYTFLGFYYAYDFILNYSSILSYNRFKILECLDPYDDVNFYDVSITILTLCVITAFCTNFFRAVNTLLMLEYGKIEETALSTIKGQRTWKWREPTIRLLVAGLLLYIEKQLGANKVEMLKPQESNVFEFKDSTFLLWMGVFVMGLYILLLCWRHVIKKIDADRKLHQHWYSSSLWQFWLGFITGLMLSIIGFDSSAKGYKHIVTVSLLLGIVSSISLFVLVVYGEWTSQSSIFRTIFSKFWKRTPPTSSSAP